MMRNGIFILIATVLITSCSAPHKNENISMIENKLGITIPNDLVELWSDSTFTNVNREFYYRNFGDLIFLIPEDLTEFTLEREVGGAMNEQNKLYYLEKEGKITNEQKRELTNSFYRDIVMMSKSYSDEKVLVFAASTWREAFINIYYKFDSQGKTSGIFLTDGDQGSLVPIYLGKNLEDVFGDISRLKDGFTEMQELTQFMYNYCSDSTLKPEDFPYGIFPNSDMRMEIKSIVPDILIIENKYVSELTDSVKSKIEIIYNKQGKILDYDEKNLNGFNGFTDIASFLKDKNCQDFNDKKDYRIFIVEYPCSEKIGIALCTPGQARELNELGVLYFDWMERAEKEFKFMDYKE